jgi:hypothetical protein
MATDSLSPTYYGYIASRHDALLVFEASLRGILNPIPRRPNATERTSLIQSGCVVIYNDQSSGIQRWTDGVRWSPSRVMGDFLVYHELQDDCQPREKRMAGKHSKKAASISKQRSPLNKIERDLTGPLNDSSGPGSLRKKSISIKVGGALHRLISYYTLDDVSKLSIPSNDLRLQNICPRSDLTGNQSFRKPSDEVDVRGSTIHRSVYDTYLQHGNQNVIPPGSPHSQLLTPYMGPSYHPGVYRATARRPPPRPPPLATNPPWIPSYSGNDPGPYHGLHRYSSPTTQDTVGGSLQHQYHFH